MLGISNMTLTVVFVPGILGSELVSPDGEVVWPPKATETILGYDRIDKLQSATLRATQIIRNVSCVKIYEPILSLFRQLGFGPNGTRKLVEHPYDWRQDLFDLADGLADQLDKITVGEIIIVAHSMGGLISRLVLETDTYRSRPFYQKITNFIALATPHSGAPLALARVLGLDKSMGISAADFKRLSENENYPSGYQLLPAPGEDACWDTSANADMKPLDYYDPQIASALGMKPDLVARARALHEALRAGSVPAHARYFYFSGAGHKTVTRVNIHGQQRDVVSTVDAGDGTVPMWSALPHPVQKQVVVNEHANVFRGLAFKRVFFRLLGGDAGQPRETLEALEAEAAASNQLQISLQKPVFGGDEPIEVVIASETPIADLEGRFVFNRLTDNDRVEKEGVAVQDLRYVGPGIHSLAMTLKLELRPGFYELHFDGDRPITERVVFAVSR